MFGAFVIRKIVAANGKWQSWVIGQRPCKMALKLAQIKQANQEMLIKMLN